MYTVFLAGGIASGKSTVARELERLGALRIDADQLSRDVLEPGSPCLGEVAAAFGQDLLDPATGALDRGLLARRAFASAQETQRLEDLELPHIRALLRRRVEAAAGEGTPCCLVEVPLLDRAQSLLDLADEVLCVTCPLDQRLHQAVGRGMDEADFRRRLALQPSDDYLRAHADTVIANDADLEGLLAQVRRWWEDRRAAGWQRG